MQPDAVHIFVVVRVRVRVWRVWSFRAFSREERAKLGIVIGIGMMIMPMIMVMAVVTSITVRVPMAVTMIVTSMAMVSKTRHSNQVDSQPQTTNNKELSKALCLATFCEPFRGLNHDLDTDQPATVSYESLI